jgi:HPr kinase/phosphorylase
MRDAPTIHASAVLAGARALLIRGPAGEGKSRLVLGLIEAAESGLVPFARLVTDDRAHLEAANGRLLVRAPKALQGYLEVRGLGIRQLPFEACAVVGWVADLAAADAGRLPPPEALTTEISGIKLPRLAVAAGEDPLPLVLAALRTS